jgi:hypothetical protein
VAILLSGSTGWLGWPLTHGSAPKPRSGEAVGARPTALDRPAQRTRTSSASQNGEKPDPAGLTDAGAPASRVKSELPTTAVSQYLKTTRGARLSNLGCRAAKLLSESKDDSAVSVLAFGRPLKRKGRWGASLFGHGFRTISQIQAGAQAYAQGYVNCWRKGPRLTVAIGTSNYGNRVSYAHGRAWALMVNGANQWAGERGYVDRVEFAGANDIELSWNGPRVSRAWVNGYDSVAEWPYYDFGDAAGCPPRGNCAGAWTPEDVWYVSWGARAAWPLPQIYTPNGVMARQWYHLSLYSFVRHGWHMTIAGALSQHRACRQSSDPCRGMNNSPHRAWSQLNHLLNRDRRTAQRLPWLTDFGWGK